MKILLMALVVAGMVGTVIPAQGGGIDKNGVYDRGDTKRVQSRDDDGNGERVRPWIDEGSQSGGNGDEGNEWGGY